MVERFDGKLLSKFWDDHDLHVYVILLAAEGYRMILHQSPAPDRWWDFADYQTVKRAFQIWDPLTEPEPSGWFRSSAVRTEENANKNKRN